MFRTFYFLALFVIFFSHLSFWTLEVGATDRDAEVTHLGAISHGAEVFTTRLRWRRHNRYLDAMAHGAELGATSYGSEVSAADCLALEREETGNNARVTVSGQSPRRRASFPGLCLDP